MILFQGSTQPILSDVAMAVANKIKTALMSAARYCYHGYTVVKVITCSVLWLLVQACVPCPDLSGGMGGPVV